MPRPKSKHFNFAILILSELAPLNSFVDKPCYVPDCDFYGSVGATAPSQPKKFAHLSSSLQAKSSRSKPLIKTSAVAMFVANGILFASQCLNNKKSLVSFSLFASLK